MKLGYAALLVFNLGAFTVACAAGAVLDCALAEPAAGPEAALEFQTDLALGECRVAVAPGGAGRNLLLCRTDPNPGVRCYWSPGSRPAPLSCVAVAP